MSGEGGSEDVSEGEVLGGTASALLPIEEEFAVAVGEAGRVIDVKFGQGAIDPIRRAFQFCVVSDRGLVDDEMDDGVGDGVDVRPLSAEFFVDERWGVTELLEDGGECWAILNCSLGFDADFVARDVGRLIGQALMGEGPGGAVVAEA